MKYSRKLLVPAFALSLGMLSNNAMAAVKVDWVVLISALPGGIELQLTNFGMTAAEAQTAANAVYNLLTNLEQLDKSKQMFTGSSSVTSNYSSPCNDVPITIQNSSYDLKVFKLNKKSMVKLQITSEGMTNDQKDVVINVQIAFDLNNDDYLASIIDTNTYSSSIKESVEFVDSGIIENLTVNYKSRDGESDDLVIEKCE